MPDMLSEADRKKLWEDAKGLGWSNKQIASQSGVSLRSVQKLFQEKLPVRDETVGKIRLAVSSAIALRTGSPAVPIDVAALVNQAIEKAGVVAVVSVLQALVSPQSKSPAQAGQIETRIVIIPPMPHSSPAQSPDPSRRQPAHAAPK